jgi:RHS repeat-associated protein
MKKLAVCLPTGGAVPAAYVGAGKRYLIDGNLRVHEVARSGEWALDATSVGGVTTFTVNAHAAITPEMQGWILQPDINRQVYAPILYTDPNTHTVTVGGDYAAIGTQGTRFRIHAMPGTVTYGEKAGVLMESTSQHVWVAAASSRCLYNGYRYEAPLAGTTELIAYTLQTMLRQTGQNFAGQHYTLHRHYDPNLMRFTSPDPAATPFHNLGAYCGNSPAGGYDPDGLSVIGPYRNDWENRPTEALINTGLDIFGTALTKAFAGPLAMVASGFQVAEGENVGDTFVGQQVREVGNRYEARVDNNSGSLWGHISAMQGIGNDMAGITAMGESITGRDNITGQTLSDAERYNRFVDGTSSLCLTATAIAGPKVIPWASRVGGKARVGGIRTPGMSPMKAGKAFEARRLGELGLERNTSVWRPTSQQMESSAFKVIVGKAKRTSRRGKPKGTRLDSIQGDLLELKGGRSTLNSTYQLRLQVYMSVMEGTPLTLRTTRPINPTFRGWLKRWGVQIEDGG